VQQVTQNVLTETRQQGSDPSIVNTTEGVVIIDTPQLPTDAVAMRKTAEELGPIRYIFNTEHHCDHIFGNYYFRGAGTVVHHSKIHDLFMVPEPNLDPYEFVADLVRRRDSDGMAIFPDRSKYYENLNEGTITFSQDMTVSVGNTTFELIHTPGHTPGQTAIYVPEERVVFTGDSIFSDCQTWLMNSNIDEWLVSLDRIASLDVDYVVPGHGPVTTGRYVRRQRAVLLEWIAAVAEAVARGWSREETMARVNPGSQLPVDVGLEHMTQHIGTLNAASLWDKLTSAGAARP